MHVVYIKNNQRPLPLFHVELAQSVLMTITKKSLIHYLYMTNHSAVFMKKPNAKRNNPP